MTARQIKLIESIERDLAMLKASIKADAGQPERTQEPTTAQPEATAAWKIYLQRNPDVARSSYGRSASLARAHWLAHGREEYQDGNPSRKPWPGEERKEKPASSAGGKPYHHYNRHAWTSHGTRPPGGIALILGYGQHATGATWNGRTMQKHGSLDKGREIWTIRDPSLVGKGATIVLNDKQRGRLRFTVPSGKEISRGDFWRD